MDLKEQIASDLNRAMKARDAAKTSTLRMVKAALKNREIEKGGELSEDEILKVLQSLVKQRKDSVEQYEKGNRRDLADKERAEIEVIEGYLPKAASQQQMQTAVEKAIAETGATSMKEMGAVMKAAQSHLAESTVDGKALSEIVKQKLSRD